MIDWIRMIERRLEPHLLRGSTVAALVVGMVFALTCVSAVALGALGHAIWTGAVAMAATANGVRRRRQPPLR